MKIFLFLPLLLLAVSCSDKQYVLKSNHSYNTSLDGVEWVTAKSAEHCEEAREVFQNSDRGSVRKFYCEAE